MGKSIKKEIMKNDPSCASTPQEKMKWEIAKELGIYDKVLAGGWKSLSAKESRTYRRNTFKPQKTA